MIAEKFSEMLKSVKYPNEDTNDFEAREIERLQNLLCDIIEARKEKYRKLKIEYQNKKIDIENDFKLVLFKEYNIENHPNKEKIYSRAWEEGHSYGLEGVEQKFAEIYNACWKL